MNVMLVRRRPRRIAFSDASSVGCGSVIVVEGKVFQRNWSHLESSGSSTFRELEGYTFSRSFCVLLQSKGSLVYSTQSFFLSRVPVALMLFPRIGLLRIIGCALQPI